MSSPSKTMSLSVGCGLYSTSESGGSVSLQGRQFSENSSALMPRS